MRDIAAGQQHVANVLQQLTASIQQMNTPRRQNHEHEDNERVVELQRHKGHLHVPPIDLCNLHFCQGMNQKKRFLK